MPSRFEVHVREDGLEARVDVAPGMPATPDDLLAAVAEAGVHKGILDDVLCELAGSLADPEFAAQGLLVAQGAPPRAGVDGVLELLLTTDIEASHLEPGGNRTQGEDARSGYTSVVPGRVVGSFAAQQPGEPGWTVQGEELPSGAVRDPLAELGEGFEATPAGKILATSIGVVMRRAGEPLCVQPLPSHKRLLIQVSEDAMRAEARVLPGDPGDAAAASAAIEAAGVTSGVLPQALSLLAESLPDALFAHDALLLAQGTVPTPGENGRFEPHFAEEAPVGRQTPGRIHLDGHIDYRDRSLLTPVAKGEVLGVYVGAEPGTPGFTVHGEAISATAGVEQMPTLGEGVRQSKKSTAIHAARAGVILYQEGKGIDVIDVSEHRGNVDLASGDLQAAGALLVTGNVCRNALVAATGPVVIKGLVDGGCVRTEASVSVAGGVIGRGKTRICAGGDVLCRHALGAEILCRGALDVQKTAVSSFLHARVVGAQSDSLVVVGGCVQAEERIAIREAGSAGGGRTVLAVGVALPELSDPAGAESDADHDSNPARNPGTDEAIAHREEVDARRRAAGRIEVSGTVHPGVVVQIGSFSKTIEEPIQAVSFHYDPERDPPIVAVPLVE